MLRFRSSVAGYGLIPVFVLIIASVVTVIELAMNAWFHELYLILGIFIPLIVTNCTIIARAESFASKNAIIPSVIDGLFMGIGFMAVLVVLGAMRELVGFGTLLAHADLMFGEIGKSMTLQPWEQYRGYLLAILPPGAFLGLGFIIALKNVIDRRRAHKKQKVTVAQPEPA
jgi:electron transport complex protein RnfE